MTDKLYYLERKNLVVRDTIYNLKKGTGNDNILNDEKYIMFLNNNCLEDSKENRIKYFEDKNKKLDEKINNCVCDIENFIFIKYYKEKFKNIDKSHIKLKQFYKYNKFLVGNHLKNINVVGDTNDDIRQFIKSSEFQFVNSEYVEKFYSIYDIFDNEKVKAAIKLMYPDIREDTKNYLIEKEMKKRKRKSNKILKQIKTKIFRIDKPKQLCQINTSILEEKENFRIKISDMENYSETYYNESTNDEFIKEEIDEKENC